MSELNEMLEPISEMVVLPLVRALSKEAKQDINICIVVSFHGVSTVKNCNISTSNNGVVANGMVKVLVKDSYHNYSFAAEAIINGLSLGTGYSGFYLKGKLKFDDAGPAIKLSAQSNRYNVWEWSKNFLDIRA